MADISKIRLGNQSGTYTEYDIKDAAARQAANDLDERVDGIEQDIRLGDVYDVSAKNSGATFASLSALLSNANLSTLIPTTVRKGGMSIRFVTTSDNKYVQYRYMQSDATTVATFTNVDNWQGVDSVIAAKSKNIAESGAVDTAINNVCDNGILSTSEDIGYLDNTSINVNSNFSYIQQRVVPGSEITIKANPNAVCVYIQVKNKVSGTGSLSDNLAGGMTKSFSITAGNSRTFTAGADCNFIIMRAQKFSSQTNYLPEQFTIDGIDYTKPLQYAFSTVQHNIDTARDNADEALKDYQRVVSDTIGGLPMLVPYYGTVNRNTGIVAPSTSEKYYMVPCEGGQKIEMIAGDLSVYFGFGETPVIVTDSALDLHDYLIEINDDVLFTLTNGNRIERDIPNGTKYILLVSTRLPQRMLIDGIDYTYALYQQLISLGQEAQMAKEYSYLDNKIWGQWITPMIETCNQEHNRIYFGWTSNDGKRGVTFVNRDNGYCHSFVLNNSGEIDDHTPVAVKVLKSRYILCAWAGHNSEAVLHIRRSSVVENIDNWYSEVQISVPANATNAQIHQRADGRIYIFTRCNEARDWNYVYSDDDGVSWSVQTPFVRSSSQWYLLLRETDVDGVFNFVCYANPGLAGNNTNIRAAYWNSYTNKMYDATGTEIEQKYNADIPEGYRNDDTRPFWWWTSVPIIISKTFDGVDVRNRLHDLAITSPGEYRILYNIFPDDMSEVLTSNSLKYYLYDNGTVTYIVDCGLPFYNASRYTGGGNFSQADNNKIYLSRNDNGSYLIEKYAISNGNVIKENTLYQSVEGKLAVRPKVSADDTALVFFWGYMNPDNFREFDTNMKLINLRNE